MNLNSLIKKFTRILALLSLVFSSYADANHIIRDPEIEHVVNSVVNPLLESIGKTQQEVSIYIIADPSINAFVQGGQNIFIHTGLLTSLRSQEELAAVIAHELGHITGGHLLKSSDAQTEATFDALLTSAVVGIAAGLSGGSGDAVAGALLAGSQAGMGSLTAFTRIQEASADQAALDLLKKSRIDTQAMINVLKMLSANERGASNYMRSHPLSLDRIENINHHSKSHQKGTIYRRYDHVAYQRMQAKLNGFLEDPNSVLSRYSNQFQKFPEIVSLIASISAYHKMGQSDKAFEAIEKGLEKYPNDFFLYDLAGQIALETGNIEKSIDFYRQAYEKSNKNALIGLSYGKALVASEKKSYFSQAIPILKNGLLIEKRYAQGYRDLSIAYDRLKNYGYSRVYSAEYFLFKGDYNMAMNQAQKSLLYLKNDDPYMLRAKDIIFFIEQNSRR